MLSPWVWHDDEPAVATLHRCRNRIKNSRKRPPKRVFRSLYTFFMKRIIKCLYK